MSVSKILGINYIVGIVKKPRVRAGFWSIIKVIPTFGIAYSASRHTREQWNYAFKNRIVIHSNLGDSEELKIVELANQILLHTDNKKPKDAQQYAKKIGESFLEMKEAEREFVGNFEKVKPGSKTKKLFGKQLYQVVVNDEVTYVAPIAQLGEGAFNKVYLAVDILNAKIRVLREMYISDEVELGYLQKEYDIQEELQAIPELRPKMIKVLARKGTLGLLSFANFGSIDSKVNSDEFSSYQRKVLLMEFVEFMVALHNRGYVIGDLKSENVLLKQKIEGELHLKVADFGGAIQLPLPEGHASVFTPFYGSPEQFLSNNVSKATDAWALGIVMLEMKYCLITAKSEVIPLFVQNACDIYTNQQISFQNRTSQAYQCFVEGFKSGGFESILDLQDPYDQVIASLLQFLPDDRANLEDVLQLLEDISTESYLVH